MKEGGKFFKKKGLNIGLIAADVHRPAAYDQLSQIGEQIPIPVYGSKKEKKAATIVDQGLNEFKDLDIVIVEIDDESYEYLNEPTPYSRSVWARAVRNLTNAGAKVVTIDIEFDKPFAVYNDQNYQYS